MKAQLWWSKVVQVEEDEVRLFVGENTLDILSRGERNSANYFYGR